jgi:glucose/arabinose dehydrogenase
MRMWIERPDANNTGAGKEAREEITEFYCRVRVMRVVAMVALASLCAALPSSAQVADPVPGPIPIGVEDIFVEFVAQLPDSGSLSRPRARPMTLVGDGAGRTFVADQNGFVLQLFPNGSTSVFLDVLFATPLLTDQGQRGLSSVAFHPDYYVAGSDGEGKIYTSSSEPLGSGVPDFSAPAGAPESHESVVYEWTVSANPDAIDTSSARELLRVVQTYGDHNIAQLSFEPGLAPTHPDYGLLFIALGDGGNVCCPRPSVDPWIQGQDISAPLGSLLRIDPVLPALGGAAYSIPNDNVFASDGDPSTLAEIWVYGLRNPHRFSWDSAGTGKMLISDIGQANVEEINLGIAGANYGWSEREGTYSVMHFNENDVFMLPPGDALLDFTYPVLQYDHDESDLAISGGYVQRGGGLGAALEGHYIFGDLVSGRVFHSPVTSLVAGSQASFEVLRLIDAADDVEKSLLEMVGGGTPAPRADLRFGRDDAGRIFLLTKRDGSIRRLTSSATPVPALAPGLSCFLVLALISTAATALRRRRLS